MFITLITVYCLGEVCSFPKDIQKTTIQSTQVIQVTDHKYYWSTDGHVEENGHFQPNKNATLMNGCVIAVKDFQRPLFTELPCDTYVLPKLKACP